MMLADSGAWTSTSTAPAACGGATTTTSVEVMSTIPAAVSPKLTYQEQMGAGQPRGGSNMFVPWMCTISPPRVRPDAGEIVETVTSAESVVTANARTAAAQRVLMKRVYGTALRSVAPATSQPGLSVSV